MSNGTNELIIGMVTVVGLFISIVVGFAASERNEEALVVSEVCGSNLTLRGLDGVKVAGELFTPADSTEITCLNVEGMCFKQPKSELCMEIEK